MSRYDYGSSSSLSLTSGSSDEIDENERAKRKLDTKDATKGRRKTRPKKSRPSYVESSDDANNPENISSTSPKRKPADGRKSNKIKLNLLKSGKAMLKNRNIKKSLKARKGQSKSKEKQVSSGIEIKRKKLKVDEEAEKDQDMAVKLISNRSIMSDNRSGLEQSESNILPPVILRCNMSELIVKKQLRKKEKRYLFVLPGQLTVLNPGVSGRVYNLSTNSPYIEFDFGFECKLKFYGNIIQSKNDYLALECKQNGKQVFCHDAMSSIVVFHTYEWQGKYAAEKQEDKAILSKIDWNKPSIFEAGHETEAKTRKEHFVESSSLGQETDKEVNNINKQRMTLKRKVGRKIDYGETGSDSVEEAQTSETE